MGYILKDYGVEYFSTPFSICEDIDTQICGYDKSGLLAIDRATCIIPWDEMDPDTSVLPADGIGRDEAGNPMYGIFGMHWPNLLNRDPNKNHLTAEKWIEYIKNIDEQFTAFVSPDLGYAGHQLLYLKHAKIGISDNCITLDVSDVPSDRCFKVNIRACVKGFDGCDTVITKVHSGFTTYEISPKSPKIKIYI